MTSGDFHLEVAADKLHYAQDKWKPSIWVALAIGAVIPR
jgi:hypothetical protein